MDGMLHLLDSFSAHGSDGRTYTVRAYEQLVADPSFQTDGREHWEPTGRTAYRLADGAALSVERDGVLRIEGSGVELRRQ